MISLKKILFFINDLQYGGAEKVLVNLINNMDKSRYDITLLLLFDVGVNKRYVAEWIKTRYVFPRSFRGNTRILRLFTPEFLYSKFINDEYDIVIGYLEGIPVRIIAACPYPYTKKIAWQHLEILNKQQLVFPVYRSEKECLSTYRKLDAIVGVSQDIIKSLEEQMGFKDNLYVKYNTNNQKEIINKSKEPIEGDLFVKDKINIVSVGRLVHQKGYSRLLQVFNSILHDEKIESSVHLYIIGTGEKQTKLQAYIEANNLTNQITLLGFKDNPYKYVAKADLFVCSSFNEGFSTAVTESLILGTPVLTTLCSGMHELLGSHNEYGLVVDNSEEGLLSGLRIMLTKNGMLEYYTDKAKERGIEFSLENTVSSVEQLLETL